MKKAFYSVVVVLALSAIAYAQCQIVRVVDGDTFDVKCGTRKIERIRPIAVDAPDSCGRKKQGHFDAAVAKAKELLPAGSTVMVQRTGKLSFNRTLARVIFFDENEEPSDFAKVMIKGGFAHFDETGLADYKAEHPKIVAGYRLAQELAQRNNAGIWSDPSSVLPKEWRAKNCSGKPVTAMRMIRFPMGKPGAIPVTGEDGSVEYKAIVAPSPTPAPKNRSVMAVP